MKKKPVNRAMLIRNYMRKFPTHSPKQIAEGTGVKVNYVYQIQHTERVKAAKAAKAVSPVKVEMIEPKADPVNHPPHYKAGGIETIDFIEAKKLNYNLGNVVKYITRADLKGNRKQDLAKAAWYLQRELGAV